MNKVIIACNLGEDEKKNDLFRMNMATAFSRLKMDGFETDSENVFVITKKEQIENINLSEVSVIVSAEEVDGVRIGMGNLNRWRKANPDAKIILIVSTDKKASVKLNSLYEAGFYTVLYNSDFSWRNIKDLLINGRSEEAAYEYFGLADFTAPVKNDKRQEVAESKDEAKADVKKNTVKVSIPDGNKKQDNKVYEKKSGDRREDNKNSTQKGDKKPESAKEKSDKPGKNSKNKDININAGDKNSKFADKSKADDSIPSNNSTQKKPLTNKSNEDKGKELKPDPVPQKKSGNEKKGSDVKQKNQDSGALNDKKVAEQKNDNSKTDKSIVKENPRKDEDAANLSKQKKAPEPKIEIKTEPSVKLTDNVSTEEYLAEDEDTEEYDELDTSEFLVLAMEDEELPDVDWLSASDEDVDAFIKQMNEKAFNQVTISKELTPEEEVLEEILRFYTKEDPIYIANLESGLISRAQFEQDLSQKIAVHKNLSDEQKRYVFESFGLFMWNYDIITPFIEDPAVSDIALVDWDNIQIKRYGVRYFSKIIFRSEAHYRAFINHVVKHNHVDLTDKMPDKTFMDTTTSESARMRFVYSQEYINAHGEPSLIIRKVPTTKFTIQDLVDKKMMTCQTAAFILDKIRRGASFVFTGTMASGKSTCMNTYLDYIRGDKRGLGVQENDELFSKTHKMFMFQNIRISEDGTMMFDLRYLTRYGLLMDIDYLINGEIKGAESEQFIEAVFANIVTITSVHSPSAYLALPRLADLGTTDQFSRKQQLRKLAEGIDFVVYLDKFVIMEIAEVVGWDEEKEDVIYNPVNITIPKKKINTTKYKRLLRK